MSISDDLQVTPKDMPVYSEEDGRTGRGATFLPHENATSRELVIGAGLDPDLWQISGKVNTRRWMRYDGSFLYYYKFDVAAGESTKSKNLHIDDLVKQIRRRVKASRPAAGNSDATFVFVLADWQIGKREGDFGTPDTIRRFRECLDAAVQQVIRLRKAGVAPRKLAILSVGDLVEGCGDHYAMQQFSVDLDRRSQCRAVRELLTETILALSSLFDSTIVAAIAGNHGENRKDGKAFTTFADNDDVATVEAVAEAFSLAGWDGRVEWVIPEGQLSQVVDLGGVKIGMAHGHQFRGGTNAQKKAEDWWRGQDFGLEAVREAQVLLSGHFHHLNVVNIAAGRTWIQAPTIDPGSRWYTDSSGTSAVPGVLTFVADPDSPVGYDWLRVMAPSA